MCAGLTVAGPAVPAIILAAGASTRLGRPKQLERLRGERLLERAVRLAVGAGLTPTVVLGCAAELIERECALPRGCVLLNPDWRSGMASSVRAGLAALPPDVPGALLMTCDQPGVTAMHLRQLVAQGLANRCVVGSAYAGKRGVPAWFPAEVFPRMMQLVGDTGARELLGTGTAIDLEGGELDVDTEEALARARLREEGPAAG